MAPPSEHLRGERPPESLSDIDASLSRIRRRRFPRAPKITNVDRAKENSSLTVPWDLRPIKEHGETDRSSWMYTLSSPYLWWKLQYATRCALICYLPAAALTSAYATQDFFYSRMLILSAAFITGKTTYGESMSSHFEWMKSVPLYLPLCIAMCYVKPQTTWWSYGIWYFVIHTFIAFFSTGLCRRLGLLITNTVFMGFYGKAKHRTVWYSLHLTFEYLLGSCLGIIASLLPYPFLAARRAHRLMSNALMNVSLCFGILSESFWAENNLQRRICIVRVGLARDTIRAQLAEINSWMTLAPYEPLVYSVERQELLKAKCDFLAKILPIIDSTLRIVEALSEDPLLIHGSIKAQLFGERLQPCLKHLSKRLDQALLFIAKATTIDELIREDLEDPESTASRPSRGELAANSNLVVKSSAEMRLEGEMSGRREQSFAEFRGLNANRSFVPEDLEQQYFIVDMAEGRQRVGIFTHLRHALSDFQNEFTEARLFLFYGRILDNMNQKDTPVEKNSPAGTVRPAVSVQSPLRLNIEDYTTGLAPGGASTERRSLMGGTVDEVPESLVYNSFEDIQEFTSLMAFYMFCCSLFGENTIKLKEIVVSRCTKMKSGPGGYKLFYVKDTIRVFWEPLMSNLIQVKHLVNYFRGESFKHDYDNERQAVVDGIEALKIGLAMILDVVFNYWFKPKYAFMIGPNIITFVVANSSCEALYAGTIRLFGTLFGGVVGWWGAEVTKTRAEKVTMMVVQLWVAGFFRSGKEWGVAALFAMFLIVPLLFPTVTSEVAIIRVLTNTVAVTIYFLVSALIIPTKPAQMLKEKRVMCLSALDIAMAESLRAFTTPFPSEIIRTDLVSVPITEKDVDTAALQRWRTERANQIERSLRRASGAIEASAEASRGISTVEVETDDTLSVARTAARTDSVQVLTLKDPFLSQTESAIYRIRSIMKSCTFWKGYTEREPTMTATRFPKDVGDRFHHSLLRMVSFLELMLEALRIIRIRTETVSEDFNEMLTSFEEDAIYIATLFTRIMHIVTIMILKRHSDLTNEANRAVVQLEEACLTLHRKKSEAFHRMVYKGQREFLKIAAMKKKKNKGAEGEDGGKGQHTAAADASALPKKKQEEQHGATSPANLPPRKFQAEETLEDEHQVLSRVVLPVTNADAAGAHSFTFCIVLLCIEVRQLMIAAEGLQQAERSIT